MENDIAELKAYVIKLRTDLTASNLTMLSIASTLTAAQRLDALRAIAQHSVQIEQSAEQTQQPAALEAMESLQASVQRHYSQLEGMHKLQLAKERPLS